MPRSLVPRSLVWATSIDVLPPQRVVTRHDGYLAVRSPTNPTHYWGNLLVFDDAPAPGDGLRWEALFAAEFADEPRVIHRTFAWDRTDDVRGASYSEFRARGYDVDLSVGMIARPDEIHPHPRANPDVVVKALDPESGGPDERHWRPGARTAGGGPGPGQLGDRGGLRRLQPRAPGRVAHGLPGGRGGVVRGPRRRPGGWLDGDRRHRRPGAIPGGRHRRHPPPARHLLAAARRCGPPCRRYATAPSDWSSSPTPTTTPPGSMSPSASGPWSACAG